MALIPDPWRATAQLVLAVALIVGLFFGVRQVLSWKEAAEVNAETVKQQARTADATSAIVTTLDTQTQDAQRVEVVVSQGRDDYMRHYEELRRENAPVAEWTDARVPVELRDAARARRLERERSGSVASWREGDRKEARASGRDQTQ